MSTVARFEVCYTQYLDPAGELVGALPEHATCEQLVALYRAMALTRAFDKRAVALQRTGKLGTYASSLGQEAIGAAVGHAMRAEDVLFTMYREHGAQLLRGVRMSELLLYWGGDERGSDYAQAREDFPNCVPIATHTLHAVGVAYAMKLRREPRVAVCMLGDGSTSKGDFYEALNAAGVWQLPLVFVINNNQWAISMPRSLQSRAQTLAQKAIAAGITGEQVDGDDVIAVRERFEAALDKARAGDGPHLIEALSYRMHDHTTADDASRYRSQAELDEHARHDPIERLRTYLAASERWTAADEDKLHAELAPQIEQEVERYLSTPARAPQSMFDCLYETLPAALAGQRALAAGEAADG